MKFEYYDLRKRTKSASIDAVFPGWEGENETIAVFSPHDDDGILGAGYAILAALENKAEVYVFVFCDGRAGYSAVSQKNGIVKTRKKETDRAYRVLGIEKGNIIRFDLPDFSVNSHIGWALPGNKKGVFSSIITELRNIRTTRLLLPNGYREHPDHSAVSDIGRFDGPQAGDEILADRGEPSRIKSYLEYSVWADFSPEDMLLNHEAPGVRANLAVKTDIETEKKIFESIKKFASQKRVISSLVESRRNRICGNKAIEAYLSLDPRPFLDYKPCWNLVRQIG